ncbi:hypothetical protein THRCLA_23024 [Thraustotheca clavata]|uniref:Uncharacterized protein n=1 Tax=Thraustotheca clavata TaxID=74557 RepID=A0A1V9YIH3_9STRA|nr:hypothetical protein THRCLA_23024 [Thraustotheca clavata]
MNCANSFLYSSHRYMLSPICTSPSLLWFNLQALGYKKVSTISSHIQSRMNNALTTLNQTNQRLDMAIDSLTNTQGFVFDVVSILRVQNCTDADKSKTFDMKADSTTQISHDIKLLQFLGQSYNIIRVLFLIINAFMLE